MAATTILTLERLPAEVFYKILNYLDTSEIFYSLYNVSHRVNAFLIGYNRYALDFRSISRFDFDIVCGIVQPKNLISLILSDDDQTPGQIGLFLSLFNGQELHRLRSLTLLQIEEGQLFDFLQHVSVQNLCSLTIKWRGGPRFRSHATEILTVLSFTISQPNLQYLDLNLWIYEIKNLLWPNNCTLQYLCIDYCSFSEYGLILRHSPHLKTLILRNCVMYDVGSTFSFLSSSRPSYRQLRSLSVENIRNIQMNTLKAFLSVTPSLVHLKLIGSGRLRDGAFDGLRWKQLIRKQLRLLNKFEFFFTTERYSDQIVDDVSSLIIPFSNKFWREEKRWFVTCDFLKRFSQIRLYSTPICQPCVEYAFKSDIISRSTLINDDADRTNGVSMVTVNLAAAITEQADDTNINPIFHQVTELNLVIDNQCLINSFQFLSTILDLSHLVKISLNIYVNNNFPPSTMNAIISLLKETPNIHTLHNYNRTVNSKMICSIVPRHIKHLQLKIDRIKDMQTILERLNHLSSVTFQIPVVSRNYPRKIIKWLKQRGTSFTFWLNAYSIHLWFDNKP